MLGCIRSAERAPHSCCYLRFLDNDVVNHGRKTVLTSLSLGQG